MTDYYNYQGEHQDHGDLTPRPEARPVKARGLAMQERHPVTVWIVWPVLTLGIYNLVWLYKVGRELSEHDPRRSASPIGPVLVMIFLSWLIVPVFVVYFNLAKRVALAQKAAGMQVSCSPGAASALMLVLGVGVLYIQAHLNAVIAHEDTPPGDEVPLYA